MSQNEDKKNQSSSMISNEENLEKKNSSNENNSISSESNTGKILIKELQIKLNNLNLDSSNNKQFLIEKKEDFNCISQDLLKKLEESSPVKTFKKDGSFSLEPYATSPQVRSPIKSVNEQAQYYEMRENNNFPEQFNFKGSFDRQFKNQIPEYENNMNLNNVNKQINENTPQKTRTTLNNDMSILNQNHSPYHNVIISNPK